MCFRPSSEKYVICVVLILSSHNNDRIFTVAVRNSSATLVCKKMSEKIQIDEETKQFVQEILSKNNFSPACEVKYFPGSEVGDGFGSKTIGVDVSEGEKSLNLFLKCALTAFEDEGMLKIYTTEVFLYKTIIPTYYKMLKDRDIEDGFRNAPKCYGVYEKPRREIIAMDNLRKMNYTLFNKSKYFDDKHLKLTLQTFAKFHAISFALKDQQRDLHDAFCDDRPNIFIVTKFVGFEKIMANAANDFLSKLDHEEDSDILERCDGLDSKIKDQVVNMVNYLSDYAILTKGDCWVNNMMIKYEDEAEENPIDIMLVDWQGVTRASPVHDIQPFFYTLASKNTLDNYKYYLKVYHDELSKRIKELGSDPNTLYPFSSFEEEWKTFALYSLGLALFTIKVILCKKENTPNLEDKLTDGEAIREAFNAVSGDEEEYLTRGKYIIRHLIKIGAM